MAGRFWIAGLALVGTAVPARAQNVQLDSLARAFSMPAESLRAPRLDSVPEAPSPAGDTTLVVDRVVAVVGNTPILASQVDEEIFSRQAQGLKLPETPQALAALRREVIQGVVESELLVQQAERDTAVKVTDQEVAEGVEQQIRKIRSNFSTEAEYASELRKAGFQTPDEYRRWLGDQQRRSVLQNRLIEKLRSDGTLKPVIPTDREMRAYFETQKGALEKRPATLSFRQVLVPPGRRSRRGRPPISWPTRSRARSARVAISPSPPSAFPRTRPPASRAVRSTGSAAASWSPSSSGWHSGSSPESSPIRSRRRSDSM